MRLFAESVIDEGMYCCRIEPTLFDVDAPEAGIKLNYNICSLYGRTIGTLKYIGQGAGKFPTANAIVQDLIDIDTKNTTLPEVSFDKNAKCEMTMLQGRYYVRYSAQCAQKIEKAFRGINFTEVPVNGAVAFVTEHIPTITIHDRIESSGVDLSDVFVARM